MKNLKKIALISFLGLSTVSLSAPTPETKTFAVKEVKRHHHYASGNVDVERDLSFLSTISKDKEEAARETEASSVIQIIAGAGEIDKIDAEAKAVAHAAGLKEDEDTTDEDYLEAYKKAYNKYTYNQYMAIGGYKENCTQTAMKMVEDMITKKINRSVQIKNEKGSQKKSAVRYYTDRSDPAERALILKNLKTITVVRGTKAGFKCTPVSDPVQGAILCGKLEITFAPIVPEQGPLKGIASGVIDSGEWSKHIEPQNAEFNHARFKDVESLEDFYFMNRVTACGLAEVQMARVDQFGRHYGSLGLADTLERMKNDELAQLQNKKKGTQKDAFGEFLQRADDEDTIQQDFR